MPAITICNNDQVTIWYYPDKKIIHHQMHKFTHDEAFREALMSGAGALIKNQASKWLSDDRLNPVLNPDDQEWSAKEWRPKVLKGGLKFWAIVEPEALVNKIRMKKMASTYSKLGVTVQLFSNPDEAMEWLISQ